MLSVFALVSPEGETSSSNSSSDSYSSSPESRSPCCGLSVASCWSLPRRFCSHLNMNSPPIEFDRRDLDAWKRATHQRVLIAWVGYSRLGFRRGGADNGRPRRDGVSHENRYADRGVPDRIGPRSRRHERGLCRRAGSPRATSRTEGADHRAGVGRTVPRAL